MKILRKYRIKWDADYLDGFLIFKGRAKKAFWHYKIKERKDFQYAEGKGIPYYLGYFANDAGEPRHYYYYQDYVYESELHLEPEDIKLLIENEERKRKDAIILELERVKAKAEAEGGIRKPIPNNVQVIVWNRDGGKCIQCGGTQNLEFDHIIPLSKGGSNTARNIQLLCEKCNRSKGNKIGG